MTRWPRKGACGGGEQVMRPRPPAPTEAQCLGLPPGGPSPHTLPIAQDRGVLVSVSPAFQLRMQQVLSREKPATPAMPLPGPGQGHLLSLGCLGLGSGPRGAVHPASSASPSRPKREPGSAGGPGTPAQSGTVRLPADVGAEQLEQGRPCQSAEGAVWGSGGHPHSGVQGSGEGL